LSGTNAHAGGGSSSVAAEGGPEGQLELIAQLGRYKTIVLVANSASVDIDALKNLYRDDTLFVFFNKVFKVLDATFDREALLVSRSGPDGANILKRGEAQKIVSHFTSDRFLGVLNLVAGPQERFSPAEAFGLGSVPVRHIDLSQGLVSSYPDGKVPTSGYALATWLEQKLTGTIVVLAGFDATRSRRWRVIDAHAWTFEQVVIDLLVGAGRIRRDAMVPSLQLEKIAATYPQFSANEIQIAISEVLARRLDATNTHVDELYSVTRLLQHLTRATRALRQFSRKLRGTR
jgi:hypothetical protein